jgi:hypothetical protein
MVASLPLRSGPPLRSGHGGDLVEVLAAAGTAWVDEALHRLVIG